MSKKNDLAYKKGILFKKTLPYILKSKYLVLVTILMIISIAVLTTYTPLITKKITDEYLYNSVLSSGEKLLAINKLLVIYGLLTLVVVILRYLQQYILTITAMRVERSVREDAIRKIDFLPVDYYSLEPDGKIVSKITSDSNGVRTFYTVMFSLGQAFINIIIVYIGMILLDWRLALCILLVSPILLLWMTVYRRKSHGFYLRIRELGSRITGKLNELISGTLIIQAFNQEEAMLDDYKDLVNDYNNNDKKLMTFSSYFGWELLVFLKRIVEVGILTYFGFKYLDLGGVVITVGLITTITNYLDRMIMPINTIFNNLNELEDSIVAANRIYLFMDEENDTRVVGGKECPEIKGNIEFKNVSFSYIEGTEVLKKVNLKVSAGKTIGIVGHTGSGKSSMMNLLLGFNDNQGGQILVDGVDIKEYNKQSYRKHCGIVLQTPALFCGTIKSNVTMERDCYTDEDVKRVMEEVGAQFMLDKTSDGINMPISFKGDNLSLGEKQLIAFSRILLRNPKILVLDEATANIDSETELRIKQAMNVITKGRTTFIIAHRLSTIKDADEIIVLDHGNIVGRGNHSSLYEECDIYKDMYDSQYQEMNNMVK